MYRKKSGAFLVAALFVWAAGGRRAEAGATKPNLKVVNIMLSDPTPGVGQPISITVSVRNGTSVDAGAFDVDLFYDRGSAPAVGESGDESETVASLAGNQVTNVVFTGVTSLVEGTWSTYAIVDTDNLVDENVETDNVSVPKSIPWSAPDLLVVDITPSNSSPVVDDTISVTVSVKNEGAGDAASFTVDLFYNLAGPPSLGQIGDQTQAVLSLRANNSANVTFTGITWGTTETWNMYAIVNTDQAVNESTYANNVGGPAQVVWSAAGVEPDLTITSIVPSGLTPPVGGTISVDVTVENAGTGDVGSFRLDLFYDRTPAPGMGDTGDQNATVGGLAAGASTVVTFAGITSPVPANWSMYAIVDTLEGVAESDETNNVAGPEAVQWRGIDLIVTAVTPSDAVPLMGDTITVDVTVENLGNVDITVPFDVGLFYDPTPAPPGVGDAADQTLSVPSLDAGTATTLTFINVTSSSSGAWSMYAITDNGSAVSEYDETNNVAGPVAVTWRAPDLVIVSITPSNSSPTVGDTISVDVLIENQGDANAGAFDVGLFYNLGGAPTPGDLADQTQHVNNLNAATQVTVTFTGIINVTPGTWQMYVIVDNVASPGDVPEGDETNNVGGPTVVVWNSADQPDVVILSVTPSDANPLIGDTISVNVAVENQGVAGAGTFVVGLFYDEAAPPAVGAAADLTQSVASLAAGAQTVVGFTGVTSSTAGVWSMYAIADNGTAATESDETNNVSSPAAAVTWHAPDLVITAVTPSSANPLVGETISVDVTVQNLGDAAAGPFELALLYNQAAPPSVGDAADQTQNVASLGTGASTTLTFVGITNPVAEAWTMYAIADNSSTVTEADETNNVSAAAGVTWRAPDLVITAVTPTPNDPLVGGTISVDVTVENQGDADAGAFAVGLFYDEAVPPAVGAVADETQNAGSLLAGASTTLTFAGITNAAAESWSMYAIADNASAVAEGDETNNVSAAAAVTWRIPDLVVTAIVPSNASPAVGNTISVDVTVRNQGDADAGAFDLALFYNQAAPPVVGAAADQTQNVASLAAGAETTLTFVGITNGVVETWEMYAIADNGSAVAEGDEANNVAAPTSVVWSGAGQPDLVVLSVTPSDPDPSIGGTISVDVTVENQGPAGAGSFVVGLFYDEAAPPAVGAAADQTESVASLATGTQTTVAFAAVTSSTAGVWSMYGIADNGSAVTESDETNNVSSPATTVTWHAPELVITAVTPSNASPLIGEAISVDVTVQNQGDVVTSPFKVELFYDETVEPSVGTTGDAVKNEPGLAGGASTTVTFTAISGSVAESWSMYAIVDNGSAVAEADEDNNVYGPTAVTWRAPDLVITAVTPSPGNPLVGGTISVDVTVQNQGNADAGAFDVGLFYNEPAAPAVGALADETQNVASLAIGASTTLTFAGITNALAEAWSMYAIADNGLAVIEGDETNNVSTAAGVTWRIPDLVVTAIVPSNGGPTVGNTISVDVTVRNQGDADAGAFDLALFYNEPAIPSVGDGADRTQNVASLSAGTETTLTFAGVTNGVAETWEMYAIADNGSAVAEGDETNNVGGPTSVVWNPAARPDLVILSVTPTDADPAVGDTIWVDVTVENQGTAAAGSFDVALFYNEPAPPSVGDAADRTRNVLLLAPGAQSVLTFGGVTSAAAGTWSTYGIADNGSAVTESDETNNVSTATAVNWHAPELVVTVITPSNPDPDVGDTITVDVTVKNNGDLPAGAFDVALFYNEPSAPSVGDTSDQTQNVASLAVGAETTLTFAGVTSFSGGPWDVYAAVDNGSAVTESDETNNVTGPTAVTWHGVDLVISAITPSDPTPNVGGTISIDVTVRNLGDRDAGSFDVGLFYNRASAPSAGDGADQTQNAASLAAGGQTVLIFSGITNAVEEAWETWAIADNGLAVIEGEETNNVGGPVTITWGTPAVVDLVVVSIVPSDASPTVGGTISVDVTIENNGTLDASLFDVGLYYNLPAAPGTGDPAEQTKSVGTLAVGAQRILTFTGVTNAAAEVWQMYAMVDSGGVVVESNEANNTAGPVEVNWGGVAEIVVLVPDGGETWESGTTQQINWESYGDIGTPNVTIQYSVNGGADWITIVDPTPDDGVYDWEVPLADSAECLVMVTSEGGSYSDQSDGFFTIAPPGVGKPNLKIVSISPSNSMPNVGDTISVDVTTRNTGNAPSGLFYVDLFYNRSTDPATGEMGDQSKQASFLEAGGEVNVIFTDVSSASAGIWQMYAVVDTQGYVEESNEGDNVAGPVEVGWGTMVDSLRVGAPNGWEILEQEKTFTVTWTWTGNPGALVNIEVSANGGATWQEVVSGEINDGSYEWTVAAPASSDCRLRISNFSGTVTDVSDDRFTVRPAGASALLYLGGGCGPGAGALMGIVLLLVLKRRRR